MSLLHLAKEAEARLRALRVACTKKYEVTNERGSNGERTLIAGAATVSPADSTRIPHASDTSCEVVEFNTRAVRDVRPPTQSVSGATLPVSRPPFPDELPGLSAREVGQFSPCAACGTGTWARYGSSVSLCLACARRRSPAVLGYRDALRAVWEMTATGADADPDQCRPALDEVVRFIDDVGEPQATRPRHGWERDWHRETGRCPRCGEPGDLHGEGAG
jgi:hypothetical protein